MKHPLPLFLLLVSTVLGAISFPPPANVSIVYGEQSLDLSWDPVPDAAGYNIYCASLPNSRFSVKRKINPALITSGTHFTYIWDLENGKRERKIKGYRHYINITSVFMVNDQPKESRPSEEVDDQYFEGYDNVLSKSRIQKLLVSSQKSPFLPVDTVVNKKADFIRFMEGTGKRLSKLIKVSINPREVGACAPLSTILLKLMTEEGLTAWRVEGQFINEYHTFVVINIERVEYVVDFTADQFIPDVAPVFVPRDKSFLNPRGKLDTAGVPVYRVAKIYSAAQTSLADNKSADLYKAIYDSVTSRPSR